MRTSFAPLLFLSLAGLFAMGEFPLIALPFAWLGSIQILNIAAQRLPFSRLIHWVHALTFECFILLGVALLRFLPFRETASGHGKPILLVHGYINHGSVWRLKKKRLEALGLGPIYTINLGHPFRSIPTYAEKVKTKAEAIARETNRSDLALVGHSMGGLVSCWYATHLAPPNTVTEVITIGSPLAGTLAAHLGLGPNAREMEPNSPLLKELQVKMAESEQIRFHHIATKSDQLIIPATSATILGNPHLILEDIGHASLLCSRRVTDQIFEWLSEGC